MQRYKVILGRFPLNMLQDAACSWLQRYKGVPARVSRLQRYEGILGRYPSNVLQDAAL